MRLIDADALIAEMHNVILEDGEDRRTLYEVIERQPTIEPQRMRGKWIPIQRGFFNKEVTQVKCDQCGNLLDLIGVNCGRGDANFCPNCGSYNGGADK